MRCATIGLQPPIVEIKMCWYGRALPSRWPLARRPHAHAMQCSSASHAPSWCEKKNRKQDKISFQLLISASLALWESGCFPLLGMVGNLYYTRTTSINLKFEVSMVKIMLSILDNFLIMFLSGQCSKIGTICFSNHWFQITWCGLLLSILIPRLLLKKK